MPIDFESGLVEPDIIVNGRALTFAECMAVRVAISTFRITLREPEIRRGVGEPLASNYDAHLATVERTMVPGMRMPEEGRAVMADDDIDTLNRYMVGSRGERVVIVRLRAEMSKAEALNLAASLVAIVGEAEEFKRVLQAVMNT
jgi:hypothetical protein